ncbi:hypothetical protein HL666_11335 [Bradyrhizobium sp. 83002]|uniref:hypothetical protein n=1 Tax=Bradyrhizobium aeschynomenes TaxID=2734909 RepID=UPI00155638E7|nr:hypothetical protein [Bradyrhizobium aeschynomenes]NPU11360.1 hypothetical protein [Bradyrhizobium aeschynomenes]
MLRALAPCFVNGTEHRSDAILPVSIKHAKLCILISAARRRCYIPVLNGEQIELFDQLGVMQIAGVALPQ